MKEVTIAILAKDKEYCLPLYLRCIENLRYPKDKIHLWIRTNDNTDLTEKILVDFINTKQHLYATVHYDNSSLDPRLTNYSEHEWNEHRFEILAGIRQESIEYAISKGSDYFVVDCDNFVERNVLNRLHEIRDLGVVGPMLRLSKKHGYSNYHNIACPLGYFEENEDYYAILNQKVTGLIKVDTVHCTYYIKNEILPVVSYFDGTDRYEYARFSSNLRKLGVAQYVDNRQYNGFLYLTDQDPMNSFEKFTSLFWEKELEHLAKNNS